MAAPLYLLCFLTALACGVLLLRGYGRTRFRLLFWSGLCFVALALENLVLYVDRILLPEADLSFLRLSIALVGLALLLYGLIWNDK
jgi:hypothetical protein